jgi:signal transduction histidine kinase
MQVLINCVKNSIDAISTRRCRGVGRRGVVRLISGVYPERHGHFLSLSICDDGGGISPKILEQLSSGRRLLTTTKGEKGSGLGLNLVKDFVRRLGGRVRLASAAEDVGDLPAGTVITLCLPSDERTAARGETDGDVLEIVPCHCYTEYRKRIEGLLRE